jgi:ribonuclease HI
LEAFFHTFKIYSTMVRARPDDGNTIYVYTDGSSLGNPGAGGFGALIRDLSGNEYELSGAEPNTTNNRMEMLAVYEAFRFLNEHKVKDRNIVVQTDSMLIVKTFTAGWKKKANRDIWKLIDTEVFYLVTRHNQINWEWIKGHAGHRENEICDQLARAAASQLQN